MTLVLNCQNRDLHNIKRNLTNHFSTLYNIYLSRLHFEIKEILLSEKQNNLKFGVYLVREVLYRLDGIPSDNLLFRKLVPHSLSIRRAIGSSTLITTKFYRALNRAVVRLGR